MDPRRFPRTAGIGALATIAVAVLLVVAVIPAAAHTNHVEADAQVTEDDSVVVETVFAATPAWLVIRADAGGEPGTPLGWTRVPAEFLTGERVEIRADGWNGGAVWVVLHHPDGDGQFEPEEDERLRSFGDPVQDPFHAARGPPALVLAQRFSPQETGTANVSIRAVRMPADGAVVVRSATGGGPGEAVGRQNLTAGSHRNLTVAIDKGFYRSRPETFSLWATIRTPEGPVTAGGDPVGSRFGVVRKNPPDPTPTPTATAPATPTPTPTPTTSAAGSPPTHRGTATSPEEPTGVAGPGFGVVAALVGLAGVAALAHRNRH